MTLFESFLTEENLKKAYEYVKKEYLNANLSITPLLKAQITAIDNIEDKYFSSLSKYLAENDYEPTKPYIFYIPKDNFGFRPVCLMSLTDRIIYQAILNQEIIGNIIDKKLSKNCFANRLSKKEENYGAYFIYYTRCFFNFMNFQKDSYQKGYIYKIELDISSFFENISIIELNKILKNDFQINDDKLLNLLKRLLIGIKDNNFFDMGIPQGPDASLVLANAYLYSFDNFLEDMDDVDIKYARYVDDIVILSKTKADILKIMGRINAFLKNNKNLKLNEKTKLTEINEEIVEDVRDQKLYAIYGSSYDKSRRKVDALRLEIDALIEKLSTDNISKNEITKIKYYSKSEYSLSKENIDRLIKIMTIKESLVHTTLNTLSEDINEYMFNNILEIFKKDGLSNWSRFWIFKLLCIYADDEKFAELENLIKKSDINNFIDMIKLFYKSSHNDLYDLNEFKKKIRNSKYDIEKAIYYFFISKLNIEQEDIESIVLECLKNKSIEIQTIGLFLLEKFNINKDCIKDDVQNLCKYYLDRSVKMEDNIENKGNQITLLGKVYADEIITKNLKYDFFEDKYTKKQEKKEELSKNNKWSWSDIEITLINEQNDLKIKTPDNNIQNKINIEELNFIDKRSDRKNKTYKLTAPAKMLLCFFECNGIYNLNSFTGKKLNNIQSIKMALTKKLMFFFNKNNEDPIAYNKEKNQYEIRIKIFNHIYLEQDYIDKNVDNHSECIENFADNE